VIDGVLQLGIDCVLRMRQSERERDVGCSMLERLAHDGVNKRCSVIDWLRTVTAVAVAAVVDGDDCDAWCDTDNEASDSVVGVIINEDWKDKQPPQYRALGDEWRPVRAIFNNLHTKYATLTFK
jgi:hypothetical protein